MLFDELDPPKKPEIVLRKLDSLSAEGLQDYITELETEIARAREEIIRRGSARDKAEAFFSKKAE